MPPVEGPPVEEKKIVVGFIYPPPEVRNIVDKTANFVARNGPEFEARIRQHEQNNPKFNFLNPGDPYHAYYQHKVNECRTGKTGEKEPSAVPGLRPPQQSVSQAQQQKQQELLRSAVLEATAPKEPPPDYEFIADPPSISAFDLDVVRLTAQFVARNGRQFLTTLMNREQRNNQFDFLRPQHSLFQYFTRLLEQYTKVLIPPKDLMKRLTEEAQSYKAVMKQVNQRVDWERHQAAVRKREEEDAERERLEYAAIDWHDFSVVETIDYQPWEVGSFPPPTTAAEVGRRVLLQERLEEGVNPDTDMVLGSDDEEEPEEEQEEAMEEALENAEDTAVEGDSTDQLVEMADKETNTECMFMPLSASLAGSRSSLAPPRVEGAEPKPGIPVIKRSQTFTPSAAVGKSNYVCRLNRSDSDSCVPSYRRAPFQRGTAERRSLRWKGRLSGSLRLSSRSPGSSGMKGGRTSLDLELDLAAQQRRLQQLHEELEGLRSLKSQLEGVKSSPEPPSWLVDQNNMTSVLTQATKGGGVKSPEDRRMEKMLRKTSREIHKLRNSKTPRGQPDVVSFKEKMAFFLKSSPTIPPLTVDSDSEVSSPTEPLSPALPTGGPTLPPYSSVTSEHKNSSQVSTPITHSQTLNSDEQSPDHSSQKSPRTSSPSSPVPTPTNTPLTGPASPLVRQLTARHSSTGAIPKVFRPDVLFSSEDQGVEV
ncbi:splicing factor 3A subunit 1-like [Penaeus monodon]|uniref:splicing factor 3A subunit 1-like n=1 Tax=Penaeus monodon TaxID=6687 RepID=UPI0018A7D3EA|nr:splicing factor 3A subunit 1-like [Penaeus monodon]